MSTCNRCGFWAASDRNMVKSSFGLQCPRCRSLISRGDRATMAAAAVAADPNPYVSATFLGVVTPDDVGVEKRSIEPYAEETNLKVNLNKQKLPGNLITQWNDFYVSWKNFYASSTGLTEAGANYKTALEYRARLNALQAELDPYLSEKITRVPMPELTPPAAATSNPTSAPSLLDRLSKSSTQWSNVAIATVVVGGGLAAWLIYQTSRNVGRTTEGLMGPITKALGV